MDLWYEDGTVYGKGTLNNEPITITYGSRKFTLDGKEYVLGPTYMATAKCYDVQAEEFVHIPYERLAKAGWIVCSEI